MSKRSKVPYLVATVSLWATALSHWGGLRHFLELLNLLICFDLSPFHHFLNTRREGMPLMPESPTASKSENSNFEETIFQLKTCSMVGTQRQSQHFSVLRVMTDKLFCQHIFWQKLEVWREYGKNTILIRFNRVASWYTLHLPLQTDNFLINHRSNWTSFSLS